MSSLWPGLDNISCIKIVLPIEILIISGTWVTFGAQISDEMAEEMVTMAYESGINVFDTAEVYAAGK